VVSAVGAVGAVRRRGRLGGALDFHVEVTDDEAFEDVEDGAGLVEVVVDCAKR